jgi:RNA binding exosome subunit
MKIAHSAEVSVFCKDYEDYALVKNGLLQFFPFNIEEEKVQVRESTAEGLSGNIIKVAEIRLDKERDIRAFMENLLSALGREGTATLLCQLESRLDDELFFYIRIDKKQWSKDGRAVLTDSGNCYHVKLAVAAFPKKREAAAALLRKFLSDFA